jgi:hypothetical protein
MSVDLIPAQPDVLLFTLYSPKGINFSPSKGQRSDRGQMSLDGHSLHKTSHQHHFRQVTVLGPVQIAADVTSIHTGSSVQADDGDSSRTASA